MAISNGFTQYPTMVWCAPVLVRLNIQCFTFIQILFNIIKRKIGFTISIDIDISEIFDRNVSTSLWIDYVVGTGTIWKQKLLSNNEIVYQISISIPFDDKYRHRLKMDQN